MNRGVTLRFEVEKNRKGHGEDTGAWMKLVAVLVGACCLWGTGCAVSTHMTMTRSGIEQQLLLRSLERAVAQLDARRFIGRQITLDLFTLTGEPTQVFAKEFVIAKLKERGLDIVPTWEEASLRLVVFVRVFGINQGETLFGLPVLPTPVGIPLPELSVFKSTRNEGRAEFQVYAFDRQTGEFVDKTAVSLGQAKYNQYKILTLVSFTLSDLEE